MAGHGGGAAALVDSLAVFEALGDRTRLRLVARLSERGRVSTTELTRGSGITRQAVAKQLDALARAGVVSSVREGRERLWDLQTARLARLGRDLERVSRMWDARLERLRRLVES
jgi:DNA-binding transcriptional ArsR family regulator